MFQFPKPFPWVVTALLALTAAQPVHAQTAPAPAASTTPAAPKIYKLNLSPPFKIGQKFSENSDVTSNVDMTVTITAPSLPAPQTQPNKQASVLHFEADCEVLAITAEGQPKKVAVTVKVLRASQDGKNVPDLPVAGDKIIAEAASRHVKTMSVGDKPLSDAMVKLLKDVMPVGVDGWNDQIIFGPKEAVAVGATWKLPIPTMLLADLQDSLPTASAVEGVIKLDDLQGSGDNQVAKISSNLTLVGVSVPLPDPMGAMPAQCTVQLTGKFPTMAKGVFDESTKMNMKFGGETDANGVHLKVDATAVQISNQTITIP